MRQIALLTGSRGEYGYIRPILREIQRRPDLEYSLIVGNLHLLTDFGRSVQEIEKDGFKIADRIYMALDGYTTASMSKSLGVFLMTISDTFYRIRPDLVLLAGDRGEQLMAAFAAAHMNIPIAHIQAGELSGNIDGMTRHAITRFAHIHFASSADAAERLRRMGEQEFRIHTPGAPQLDDLVNGDHVGREEIARLFNVDLSKPLILFVQHSVTEEYESVKGQIQETLEAVCDLGVQTISIFPNNDAGNLQVRRLMEQYRRPFIHVERNLPRQVYAGLMKVASVIVGNSSSALIEAPCFQLPAVNVGNRQRGRQRGANVIDVPCERAAIRDAIKTAMSEEFRNKLNGSNDNPYWGDGQVARRIVDVLSKIEINEQLIKKQIAY